MTDHQLQCLKDEIDMADAIVIGAGSGLSMAAGFTRDGERFQKYFGDFAEEYGFTDMYSGGYHPFETLEEQWAYWSRYVYINRYIKAPKKTYEKLYQLVDGRMIGEENKAPKKHYFILTTNLDHQFLKTGFKKRRVFYTQGDYGLWQCSKPCHNRTYDNKERIVKMVLAQGFSIGADGELIPPMTKDGESDYSSLKRRIPRDLIPYCPVCGEPLRMNLRREEGFVEDAGWKIASEAYADFLKRHDGQRILFLELGVGGKTPGIIKYPFWQKVAASKKAMYACVNAGEAFCPKEIEERSLIVDGELEEVLSKLLET